VVVVVRCGFRVELAAQVPWASYGQASELRGSQSHCGYYLLLQVGSPYDNYVKENGDTLDGYERNLSVLPIKR
jgi:hypothetical protein